MASRSLADTGTTLYIWGAFPLCEISFLHPHTATILEQGLQCRKGIRLIVPGSSPVMNGCQGKEAVSKETILCLEHPSCDSVQMWTHLAYSARKMGHDLSFSSFPGSRLGQTLMSLKG
jgi:hypothetical protein